ncbi:MAG: GTPase HflX, partial [Pseudomonadota bacterium]
MTRAFVLHLDLRDQDARDPDAALAEAVSLTAAIGLSPVDADIASVPRPNPATLIGPGKVGGLARRFEDDEIDLVVVNGALSPVQQRNLERAWKAKVLDRTGLILEIFGARAQTREGVLQVELAHLTYQKSRLVRSWTHLERQRGGVGFMG